MKHTWLGLVLAGWALGVQAQWPSAEARQAESARLDARRQALEETYNEDMRLCYQQFNVTRCRLQARDRRIEAHAELRRDELAHKDLERRIKAEETQQRMAERAVQAQQPSGREQALQAAQDRAQRQADKLAEHEAKGGQREVYEQKQREAQAHRDSLEKKRRERSKPPAEPLPVPGGAR
jgi:colicin import membrane protein